MPLLDLDPIFFLCESRKAGYGAPAGIWFVDTDFVTKFVDRDDPVAGRRHRAKYDRLAPRFLGPINQYATANRNCTMYATQLGYRVHLNAGWEESNHDWDGFHQLSHLIRHQFGGLRDTALRPQLLCDTGVLVVLLEGGSGLARCVDRVVCRRSLACQDTRSSLRRCLVYPGDPRRSRRAHRGR